MSDSRSGRTRGICGVRPLALVASFAAAPAIALPDPEIGWTELDAGDFVYFSSVPPEETEATATAMESFRRELFQEGSRIAARGAIPTVVFLFPDVESLDPYNKNPGFAGYFLAGHDVNYMALTRGGPGDPMPVVYHEFVHSYLSRQYAVLPTWLNEGLAEYYSTYREDRKKVQVGRPDPRHLLSLRDNGLMPLAEVLAVDHDSPLYNEASRAGRFYAQSWLVTHYLVTEEPQGSDKIEDFLTRLEAGEGHDESLEAVLGYGMTQLEESVERYLDSKSMSFREWSRTWSPEELAWGAREIPRAELLARLAELLVAMGRLPAAAEHVDEALRLDGECALAHRAQAMLLAARGQWEGALESYRWAALFSPDDYLSHYRLGHHLLESSFGGPIVFEGGETPANVREARLHLHRAVALRPKFLEARLWYAYTYLFDGGDPAEGIRVLEDLVPLFPSRPDVAQNLVLLYLKAGDQASASRVVEDVLSRVAVSDDLREAREAVAFHALEAAQRLFAEGEQTSARHLLADIRRSLAGKKVSPELEAALEQTQGAFERMEQAQWRQAEQDAQYAAYEEAQALGRNERYEEALTQLEKLLEQDPEPNLRKAAERLADVVRYNQAVSLFRQERYRAALRVAREVARSTSDDEIAEGAKLIVAACERKLK